MPQSSPPLDPAITAYYERTAEEARLAHGTSQLELVRTRELILRHAPKPPAAVLDVGGAAGAYAFWLAELGYEVHLIDASARLVGIARTRDQRSEHRLASCTVGDARALSVPPNGADMVLMLGPLYHLVDEGHRLQALAEAARALRPGGVLIAAGISRWASLLDGLSRELLRDPDFQKIVKRDLVDGRHQNPTDRLDYFTTAYFHVPAELRQEVAAAGFTVEGLYGIEGPGWILADLVDRWNDPARREVLLQAARALESEPAALGWSAHLLVVGRRPR